MQKRQSTKKISISVENKIIGFFCNFLTVKTIKVEFFKIVYLELLLQIRISTG